MSGLTRQNSAVEQFKKESAMKMLELQEAKAELLRMKEQVDINNKKKNPTVKAVRDYIMLKAIAMKWINNTYDKISMRQQVEMKDHAWKQCISPDVTFNWDLVQNTQKEPVYIWKRDFVITANGEWFPHGEPVTPPTSPVKNKKGKTFSFADNIQEFSVEGEDLTVSESYMAEHDGPRMTKKRAFADMIELWFDQKYTTGTKVYTEFWKQDKILNFKKMGYFKDFGEMMLDAMDRYDNFEIPAFHSSKSQFKMNDTLYNHMECIQFQYEKHMKVGLNVNAPAFIPKFQ